MLETLTIQRTLKEPLFYSNGRLWKRALLSNSLHIYIFSFISCSVFPPQGCCLKCFFAQFCLFLPYFYVSVCYQCVIIPALHQPKICISVRENDIAKTLNPSVEKCATDFWNITVIDVEVEECVTSRGRMWTVLIQSRPLHVPQCMTK